MKILVTGAKGFIGKNLVAELKNRKYMDVFEYDKDTDPSLLDEYCKKADFVFHLAGVNRPKEQSEFMEGNFGFTSILLDTLKKYHNNCPVMISSSIQAELNNPYGKSKKAGEDLLFEYGKETGTKVLVYRFPNVFGKWCRPNYNSAVATFCYNISHNLPITINDPNVVMRLVYIDDVVDELINALNGKENRVGNFCEVPIVYTIKLGEIADLLYSFKKSREERSIPDMSDAFTKKLYSTYLSYLPEDQFSYELKMNVDNRGSFTEFIKTPERGQVSVNISKPGITKGNHWHHTKIEKFLVVSGKGVIRFRKVDSDEIIEYYVSGDKLEVVDIPPGYTHNIENLGDTDMVTIMWANECFDPEKPDTCYLEV
ncbi:capsular biosynthesis protein [Clostridium thermosuccinogenes]|uniref:Capsular biosynthesis protein n=1 Tax=Clostridium thermosuccinogenes TaxID=84032 RepID=A0A2K2FK07_9CLOT|nr:capsular polysaccharide biosynthesis protein CapF [Pseudoclostridium thermosuccinogenes]AUS95175.1 capsular biosynthesis protein [Pseudoclostridium thermosuccinogenes]PNT99105.1 capsular biosynthesis protein [Pseudoclostridium thermosuccinogenes]PNU00909.1 capsular biosynthesis protein [Pseudoclostridium thermosuccinogenes]